jgi:hypothetical protein
MIAGIASLTSGLKSYFPSGPLIQPTGNDDTTAPAGALAILALLICSACFLSYCVKLASGDPHPANNGKAKKFTYVLNS